MDALPQGLGGLRLDELQSFLVLSEQLHFGKAAEILHLTPGGLSRRINHIERGLGLAILARTTRCVRLTPDGQLLADFLKGWLLRLREIQIEPRQFE